MSQNTPNNPAEQAPGVGDNPYYAKQQAAGTPDLDAGAPVLKSADVQRLNRKALIFLAGIVLLLIAGAVWLFSNAASNDAPTRRPTSEERVVIPDAPNDVTLPQLPPERAEPVMPLPLADAPPVPPDLPMPPDMSGRAPARMGPSLLERRLAAGGGVGGDGSDAATGMQAGLPPEAYAQSDEPTRMLREPATAEPLYKPDTLLVRGTYIRCVLETRVVTTVPGFSSCIITEPVYSINGRRLLLPKGSKVLGSYGSSAVGGNRVAIVWDRITTPNGLNINMSSPGIDNLGSAGHPGHYDAHWPQRITSALLISMVSDAFKYAGAKHGPETSSISNGVVITTPYESNTAKTMERLASAAVDENMARRPTVTINQGEVVNVYVAQDVDFSAVLR